MDFEKGKCICCEKDEQVIDSRVKICYTCAGEIREGIRYCEHQLRGAPILEAGRGKWYFSIDGGLEEFPCVAFTPIKYWEEEGEFCEFYHLSEEEQEYIGYAVGDNISLIDELNFEIDWSILKEFKEKMLELGMIELNLED